MYAELGARPGSRRSRPRRTRCSATISTTDSAGAGPFAYLYIPNPQTGNFAFDNYQQPSSLVGNLQVSYDVSPMIRLTIARREPLPRCFGGSPAPWTAANPPSNVICGYAPAAGTLNSTLYPANFYNGTGINDFAANKARTPLHAELLAGGAQQRRDRRPAVRRSTSTSTHK